MALVHRCALVTLPTFEAGAALEMMERERCTLISGNDTLFQMLMGHADFPRRKLCLRGGWAAAGPQTMRQIIDRMGMKGVCAAYGLSEASPNVVMNDWRDAEGGEAKQNFQAESGIHHERRRKLGELFGECFVVHKIQFATLF